MVRAKPDPMAAASVRVAAAAESGGPYDVLIGSGLLRKLPELLEPLARSRWAIITDDHVAALYGEPLAALFATRNQTADLFVFAAGEVNKTRETWTELTDALLRRGLGRDAGVIALGGGVAGDLAGFVAATYMRGIPCVQAPTTLLAMIDASIGGKTGVDTALGKNLVGVIRQPALVIIDAETLETLDESEYLAGLAEAVKHGAIADAAYFERLHAEHVAIAGRETRALEWLIRGSVRIKADIVATDTLETGPRAALNFGHTIGHALEHLSGFRLPHGFAVAAGMVVEARIGEALGTTQAGTASRLAELLETMRLPATVPAGTDTGALLDATQRDKKARLAHARYALLDSIGRVAHTADGAWTFAVPDEIVHQALRHDWSGIS